ncbi:MAG: RlmE family RNA methyltransferase [Candidatus Heimdallarchaeaceae archaeon]
MSDDYFYLKAKYQGYRSRASYKLFEINDKYRLFKRGNYVVDLGASPGGWTQVASKKIGERGKVVAIDKAYIPPFKVNNVDIIQKDIFDKHLSKLLLEKYGFFDVLISDCAPNISGHYERDHSIQMLLAHRAYELAIEILKESGSFVCKAFQGSEFQDFVKTVKNDFNFVKLLKPKASRKKSSEIYVIGKNFHRKIDTDMEEER